MASPVQPTLREVDVGVIDVLALPSKYTHTTNDFDDVDINAVSGGNEDVRPAPDHTTYEDTEDDEYTTHQASAFIKQADKIPSFKNNIKKENEIDDNQKVEKWTTYSFPKDKSESGVLSSVHAEDEIVEIDYRQSQNHLPINIWISTTKQVKESSKLGIKSTFTSYLLKNRTELPEFQFKECSVWRRFKDFDNLHQILRSCHRGIFVPPLPSKNFIEGKRARDNFVRLRQADLNKFLRHLASHPLLYKSKEVIMFLSFEEDLSLNKEWLMLIEMAKTTEVSNLDLPPPEKKITAAKQDLMKSLRRMSSSFKRDILRIKSTTTGDEKTLLQKGLLLKNLENVLGNATTKALNMMTAYEDVSDEFQNLGKLLILMAKFEEETEEDCEKYFHHSSSFENRSASLKKSGQTVLKVYQFYKQYNLSTESHIQYFQDQLNLIPSALAALQDREIALKELQNAEYQLEVLRSKLDHLTQESSKRVGGLPSYPTKSAMLGSDIQELVSNVQQHNNTYNDVKRGNKAELERFDKTRHSMLYDAVLSLAKDQQEASETLSATWLSLADQLGQFIPKNYKEPEEL